jgi:hypothetical protein
MINLNISLEHPVELQLVKTALENNGFCDAWKGMVNTITTSAYNTINPTAIFQPLRSAANDATGMYYCNTDINREVRAVLIRLRLSSHSMIVYRREY